MKRSLSPHGFGEASEQRDDDEFVADRIIPKRHLPYIYGEVILFADVQSNWLSGAWYYRSVEGRLPTG